MNSQYGKLNFQKRISKINLLKRPNSSFDFHSVKNSINSTRINMDGSKKKILNNSKLIQLNNTNIYDNTFFLSTKNRSLNNSEDYNSTFKASKKKNNKLLLYEDSLKLKTKINELKNELAITKSEIRKKDEEIRKREKAIEIAKNKIKDKKSFGNLKEENIIIKLKDNYQNLTSKINKQNEENEKLANKIKKIDLDELEDINNNNILSLKEKINVYNKNLKSNLFFNNELNLCTFNEKEFIKNHKYIEMISKKIEEKTEKIYVIKENLKSMKDKIDRVEQKRKRIILYNDSIKKQNKKLLLDKKKREDYILKKPLIIRKINEYEAKTKNFEETYKNNEHELENMALEKKKIIMQLKEISKPIDYGKIIYIQKNPKDTIDQKIVLLESLIRESKDRQNEFIEIFTYYNDYIKKKENYEKIQNQTKIIENNNNYLVNKANLDILIQKNINEEKNEKKEEKSVKDDKKNVSKNKNEKDNSKEDIPSQNKSKKKIK